MPVDPQGSLTELPRVVEPQDDLAILRTAEVRRLGNGNLLAVHRKLQAGLLLPIGVPHSRQALSAKSRPRLVRGSEALLVFIAPLFLVKRDDDTVGAKDDLHVDDDPADGRLEHVHSFAGLL